MLDVGVFCFVDRFRADLALQGAGTGAGCWGLDDHNIDFDHFCVTSLNIGQSGRNLGVSTECRDHGKLIIEDLQLLRVLGPLSRFVLVMPFDMLSAPALVLPAVAQHSATFL